MILSHTCGSFSLANTNYPYHELQLNQISKNRVVKADLLAAMTRTCSLACAVGPLSVDPNAAKPDGGDHGSEQRVKRHEIRFRPDGGRYQPVGLGADIMSDNIGGTPVFVTRSSAWWARNSTAHASRPRLLDSCLELWPLPRL